MFFVGAFSLLGTSANAQNEKVVIVGGSDFEGARFSVFDKKRKVTVVGSGDQSNSDGAKADETGKVTVVGSGDQPNNDMAFEDHTIISWNYDDTFTDMLYSVCVDEAIKRRKDLSHIMRDIWRQIAHEKEYISDTDISFQEIVENLLYEHVKVQNVIEQALVVDAVEDMEVNANGQVVLFLPEFDEDENLENSSLRKGILIGDIDIIAKKDALGDEELIGSEDSCHKFFETALALPVVKEIAIYKFFEQFTDTIDMFEAINGFRSISKYLFNNDINLDEYEYE